MNLSNPLICVATFALLAGCASSDGGASAPAQQPEKTSRYADMLPATDFDAAADADKSAAAAEGSGYTRELSLEEDVIQSARGQAGSTDAQEPVTGPVQPDRSQLDMTNTFTLQLAAMETTQAAVDYAQRYDIDPAHAGVARIRSHDEVYYILAYGVYFTEDEAERASAKLESRGVPKPWIRRLSTLERLSNEASADDRGSNAGE